MRLWLAMRCTIAQEALYLTRTASRTMSRNRLVTHHTPRSLVVGVLIACSVIGGVLVRVPSRINVGLVDAPHQEDAEEDPKRNRPPTPIPTVMVGVIALEVEVHLAVCQDRDVRVAVDVARWVVVIVIFLPRGVNGVETESGTSELEKQRQRDGYADGFAGGYAGHFARARPFNARLSAHSSRSRHSHPASGSSLRSSCCCSSR